MKVSVLGVVLAASVIVGVASGDEIKLEGSWSVTSAVRNGNELPAEHLKDLRLILRDGRFAFKQGDKTLSKGTFRLDPAKTPQTIDLATTDADGKESTTLAIYELKNDTLRICGAPPGKERPGEFATRDGSDHTLTTFERVK